ncbi:hypothetical protein CQ010_15115 [Arthrobacter sp. MYb211]|uniref:heparan-alpha-glucosaminide N-acetyltransferase domain-containing protein n=1 Tax=unclassified Arthrobacter TaxID=235627 RepID=UPI000CFE1E7F|nr:MULTISPECIES: heparan-alpha-glucosaminide N-acetyltransferase domain-containing protein [unclassified Arthrobacter]PQZ97742.1 hypothetical protein CQ017_13380 [Arthrobacter sp. MYb224]PRA10176.1 hypothetical protein CQ015_15430 [Arthrobacter sp. MYb221]PRC05391.1 hypothetical protein CQ010_15115 [Arthrobacter sp. MYb211]
MHQQIERAPNPAPQSRLAGIDAARGLALLGMIAIHVLPASSEAFEPTLIWRIAAGTSAALFALLAGVGLSLGARTAGQSALELAGARAALATRAAFMLCLGLLLALIDMPAFIILGYYGVMFALAIPWVSRSAATLGFACLGFATLGTIFTWQLGASLPHLDGIDPSLTTLFTEPGATLSALLFTGTYPAVPWMSYICAGMALGTLNLRSKDLQLRLLLTGLGLWLATWASSALLLGPLGGRSALIKSTEGWLSAAEVDESLSFGLPSGVPLDSAWWQVALAPHSNMLFETLNTLGVALLVFAVALMLGQRVAWLLRPLGILGSMTLTLYTLHLLLLATGLGAQHPAISCSLQIGGALLFAVLWKNVSGLAQGPLEHLVGSLARNARSRARRRRRVAP